MRDLIRSYKMKIKRKPSISDSEESQPLVSSMSTSTSFGTLNERCMFQNDSDITDFESEKPSPQPAQPPLTKYLRRPFSVPNHYSNPIYDIYSTNEVITEKYQIFGKSNSIVPENSMVVKKILSRYISMEDLAPAKETTQSSLITIFAIWNTIMGSSLLAMAWGLEKAGLIPGIFLILFISAICLYTAYLILKVNENHGIYRNNEVPDLCRVLLGKWAEGIAKIFSLVVLIGANIVYWILMSNFLYHSVHFIYGHFSGLNETSTSNNSAGVLCPKENFNATYLPNNQHAIFDQVWDLYSTVPVFLAVLMFPLLNFKSATFFTKFNSLGTISVGYLIIFVTIKSVSWGVHIPDWSMEFSFKSTFCALSGMLSLSFFIHNIIISIVKNNKHQENNGRDLSIAYGLVTFTYLFIGVLFYICFPLAKTCIEDNILNNFEKNDALSIVARILLLFQLLTVFPLMAYMLRTDILNNITVLLNDGKFSQFSYFKVIILNAAVLIVCILFACFLPRIGTLIRYTGALSGMVYIFTLPSLLKIASLRKENALTPFKFVALVLIICIGAVNLLSQFLISD